jgi:FMN-dependent NADH-azoreductase
METARHASCSSLDNQRVSGCDRPLLVAVTGDRVRATSQLKRVSRTTRQLTSHVKSCVVTTYARSLQVERYVMTLFRLDASIRVDGSASREIADIVEREWLQAHPGDDIERRHVGSEPLPSDAWAAAATAGWTPEDQRSPQQQAAVSLAAELVDELLAADAVLLAMPLNNFGVSQHIKTWIDLIISDPRAADQSKPFLAGKPVALATVRGGAYRPETPRAGWDDSTAYLVRILRDLWGADLTVVEREFTLVGVNPALDAFTDQAAEMPSHATRPKRPARPSARPAPPPPERGCERPRPVGVWVRGIRAHAVSPVRSTPRSSAPYPFREQITAVIPLRRLGASEEIGTAACYWPPRTPASSLARTWSSTAGSVRSHDQCRPDDPPRQHGRCRCHRARVHGRLLVGRRREATSRRG